MAPKYGVLALVEAKLGKEQEVWDFLNGGREIVLKEPGTQTWYAFRVNDYTFGIFDTFDTEEARQAHLNGAIPAALGEHGPTLLSKDPDIKLVELIAVQYQTTKARRRVLAVGLSDVCLSAARQRAAAADFEAPCSGRDCDDGPGRAEVVIDDVIKFAAQAAKRGPVTGLSCPISVVGARQDIDADPVSAIGCDPSGPGPGGRDGRPGAAAVTT